MSNNEFKLVKKIFIAGTIKVETGLCIGGSDVGLEIGGLDKIVVRNPIDNKPYIPGSSLKGKMRSLLEKLEGQMKIEQDREGNTIAKPCDCGACLICKVFGVPAEKKCLPGRLIVRDCHLTNPELLEKTEIPYTETKTEVVIDRITSAATPRTFERVPAGAIFSLNLVCNIYQIDNKIDNEKDIVEKILEALHLVEDDYLGGSGTRGYGQVEIETESLNYKDQPIYEGNNQPIAYTIPSTP